MTNYKSLAGVAMPPREFMPKMFTLESGQKLQHGLTKFEVVRVVGEQVILRNLETMEERFTTAASIYDEYAARRLVPAASREQVTELSALPYERTSFAIFGTDLSEAARRHAYSLFKYITELRKLGYQCLRSTPLLELDFSRLKDRMQCEDRELINFSLRTVYEWSLKYDRLQGDYRALVPNFADRGGSGAGKRLPPALLEAMRKTFLDIRANPIRKIRTFDVLLDVQAELQKAMPADQVSLAQPSWSTLNRIIKSEFSAYEICLRNKGIANANKQFRSHYPRDKAQRPLEVVEFDDKDTRIFLIDEFTDLPMGRGFITAAVDQFSTRPLGLSISHRHRSTASALAAFRATMLPKGPTMHQAGLELSVSDAFGSPGITIFDNALYFHAAALESAIHEASSGMCAWAKPRTPTEKSVVENFNGELVEYLLSELPGFGGAKEDKSQLNEGMASASMGVNDFKSIVMQWAYNIHANKARENGLTPAQTWDASMRHTRSRLPMNLDQFDAYFSLSHEVQLRPEGVRFLGLIYQSDQLIHLRHRLGSCAKIFFRYPAEETLDRIFVRDPFEKRYFMVPSVQREYTERTSIYQHRLIRKMTRDRMIKNPSLPDLLKARADLQQLIRQSRSSSKRRERSWANKASSNEVEFSTVHATDTITVESVTELEYQVCQIDETVLEVIDEHWDIPEDF